MFIPIWMSTKYTQISTPTSSKVSNIYYTQIRHVSAKYHGLLQGIRSTFDWYSVYGNLSQITGRLYIYIYIYISCEASTQFWVMASHHGTSRSHSDTPHSVGLLWKGDQLVAETSSLQHSQQTDIHASGEMRTHNASKPAAADPRLRPRGHRDSTHTHTQYLYLSFRASQVYNI